MKSQQKTNRIVKGFLGYLSETNQSLLLPQVTKELDQMVDTSEKVDSGVVTSVLPLTPDQMTMLEDVIKTLFGRTIGLTQKIDKHILGGFTLNVGDWFVDASLAHDIAELKRIVLT